MNDIREQLMIDLQRIEDDRYELRADEKMWDYVKLMLQYIGDPKQELRDQLIYPTFYSWICEKKWFNDEELRDLLKVLLDEQHLFYHIGSNGDQSVYTRTFTVLVVTLILQRHREQPLLNSSEFINVKQSLICYYKEEKDLRGYIAEEGWAHGAAHGADALEELVQCEESDEEILNEIMAAIHGMLYNGQYILSHEEDERIASIVYPIITKSLLPEHAIADWIGRLEQCGSWPRSDSQYINRVNTKNFVRCLYFRLLLKKQETNLLNTLLQAEAKLNGFV